MAYNPLDAHRHDDNMSMMKNRKAYSQQINIYTGYWSNGIFNRYRDELNVN